LTVGWNLNENLIYLSFLDSNKNYIKLINMFSDKTKNNIVINVYEGRNIIRYYSMQILPINYLPSDLHNDKETKSYLDGTFKILKSEVNFIESTDE
jgi:hypothetical protein